jgi:hypothetical protein
MKETMERVPLMKEIVDHYSGPDRVTAKQQQGELERVARSVPVSAPDSVKQFADRAVLSLQVSIFPYHLEISYYFHTLHELLLLDYLLLSYVELAIYVLCTCVCLCCICLPDAWD